MLEKAVFDVVSIVVLLSIKLKSTYIAEAIEISWLKFILPDAHNFFLQIVFKLKDNIHNFDLNLSSDIIIFYHCYLNLGLSIGCSCQGW